MRRTLPRKIRNAWFAWLRSFVEQDRAERGDLPDLSKRQILKWADAHFERTGRWPTCHSGIIAGCAGETWMAVEAALTFGLRGLRAGSTLARFLARHRGHYNRK